MNVLSFFEMGRCFRGASGGRVNNVLLSMVAVVGLASLSPSSAQASGYTVYIYNTRTNSGWMRTGFTQDLYTTYSRCRTSIVNRVNENKRYRTDYEAFAIVYQTSSPPWGLLRSYVSAIVVYVPGRGYLASDEKRDSSGTAICKGGPAGDQPTVSFADWQPLLLSRREGLPTT